MQRSAAITLLLVLLVSPVLAQEAAPEPPCMRDESHRVFDFWIGDWEVRGPGGKMAGTNRIERILDGCVLLENWTGAGGSTGRSFNFFDPGAEVWRQIWVDGVGGHMNYRGNYSQGAMRFEGTSIQPDGTTSLMRMTFTPLDDGRVRQFIEQSTDDGATWSTWFDGYYARVTDG